MKETLFSFGAVLVLAAAPCFGEPATQPQLQKHDYKVKYKAMHSSSTAKLDRETIESQSSTGATIPFWHYNIVSPLDGHSYQGTMVGRNPFFNGHRATVIPTDIVPVKLTFEDTGTLFDPTVVDSCVGDSVVNLLNQSPIFQNVDYVMNGVDVGTTQYTDAFQRSNFWSKVAGTPYHTLLGTKILPALNVTVPIANGSTNVNFLSGCSYGTMDVNWWDAYVQNTLIPNLASQGVTPAVFPIFLFDSVFEYDSDPGQCCILGYHNSYTPNNILQTYSISSYDTSGAFDGDVSVSSHELAEWMDDPDTNNPTPAWGNVGQVTGCQANLEVGDPLSPGGSTPTNPFNVTMANGVTYTLQELAYYSWFFRQPTSIGAGGFYSNNGTFTSGQPSVCQ